MPEALVLPDFDDIADCFWRLGALQSPSGLQGYLLGQLAHGRGPAMEQWLQQAAAFIDAVEPPDDDDSRCLMDLYAVASEQIQAGEMNLQLLLPDDEMELPLRITAVGQWCESFLKGFARAGKTTQEQQGQQQYSSDVSEALSDIASISQISVEGEEVDVQQNEQDYVDVCEYLRLAVINIFLDCNEPPAATPGQQKTSDEALGSSANLFNNKLH